MNTQTVQTNPLLGGNTASPRSGTAAAAQDDGQFQQALSRQIERQAAALPPTPAPAQSAARRAEASKPAPAPKPAAAQQPPAQQARQPQAAPAAKQAEAAQPAKAPGQPAGPDGAAHAEANAGGGTAANASGSTAASAGGNAGASGGDAASAANADESRPAGATDETQRDPIADMLALMASLNQPAAAPAGDAAPPTDAGAIAAAAASQLARQSGQAAWPGMAEGAEPPADFSPADAAATLRSLMAKAEADGASGADGSLDHEALARTLASLEARIAAGQAAQSTDASAVGDAGEAARAARALLPAQGAADGASAADAGDAAGAAGAASGASGTANASAQGAAPRADFQAALAQAQAQARADAGQASDAAARDAAQAAPAALQAATAQAPAGAANAQAAHALASNQLHARVGSQGWDHQLGQKVVWMVNGGEQSATLTLNPPDLGPLQVVLSVSNDQASVAFTAAQPEVREALEQALPKLRETMGDAGITLGDASVSAGSQEQQQTFEQMAQASRGRGVANGQNNNSDAGDSGEQHAHQARRGVLGAVDTFA